MHMSLLVSMVYKVKQLTIFCPKNFTQNVFKTGLKEKMSNHIKKIRSENWQKENQLTQSSNGKGNEEPFNSHPQEKTLAIPDNDDFIQRDLRCMLHIGNDIYVVVKTYDDKLHIHIR